MDLVSRFAAIADAHSGTRRNAMLASKLTGRPILQQPTLNETVEKDAGSPTMASEAGRTFALCSNLLRAGHPEARTVLRHCLDRHPADAIGWRLVGETLLDLGKHEAALVCFERAFRATPASAVAVQVGTTLQALGRPAEARVAFADAAARDPASVRAHFLEGVAAQDTGDFEGAARAYERALSLDPELGEAALNLGTVLQEMGDLAAARRTFGRAVRLRPDSFGRAAQALTSARVGELWLDLGRLRRSLGGNG